MKKVLTIIVASALLISCSIKIPNSLRYRDYQPVKDYGQQMELLKSNFPEIYDLYRNGVIVIDEVFEYKDKDGNPKVHVTYHDRYARR